VPQDRIDVRERGHTERPTGGLVKGEVGQQVLYRARHLIGLQSVLRQRPLAGGGALGGGGGQRGAGDVAHQRETLGECGTEHLGGGLFPDPALG
jgi:hypothetical protein